MKQKKLIYKAFSLITGAFLLFSVGCGGGGGGDKHQHVFDQEVKEETFLSYEAPCIKQYYYSCTCGEKGEETFAVRGDGKHDYTESVEEIKYAKKKPNCMEVGEYYMSCSGCGASGAPYADTFIGEKFGDHDCSNEVVSEDFLATAATKQAAATYYKSCVCGLKGEETFTDGTPLRDLTDEEQETYKPVSLTMTIYDAAESIYGFTYNTQSKPLRPVIQISEGETLTEEAKEFGVTYDKWTSYNVNDNGDDYSISYYVVKGTLDLEPLTTYTYRVYDKNAEVGSEAATFTTKDTTATAFSFSHVSDTQSSPSSGSNFKVVLQNTETDFILHTGDVVEYGKYEYEWTDMLHANFEYIATTPMMALSGNHDAGAYYKAGSSELFKHFHYKIPQQKDKINGFYYSFTYGNAKFIMLNTNNTNSNALEAAQYTWLENELKNNDSAWTIVAMHAPLYAIGQWGAAPEKNQQSLALRAQLKGLFAEYGVDLVLQGHDHLVSRTKPIDKDGNPTVEKWETTGDVSYSIDPSGVIYLMNGCVGTGRKSIVGEEEGIYEYTRQSGPLTWADISIDGNSLVCEVKYHNGLTTATYEQWGIKKTA